MTTELAKPLPPMIQPYAQSLGRQERFKHRAWIGVRVEALLDPYWDKRPVDAVRDEIFMDWQAALENFAPDEIRAACREYALGVKRGIKPKPGDIVLLMELRRKAELAKHRAANPEPEPELRQVSPEMADKAKQILADVFGDKTMKERESQ